MTAAGAHAREYTVELEQFSGPLDLLLYLVRKEEVSIAALKVAALTEQYLAFLDRAAEIDVEAASDYLVMAAQLLELKARALLPDLGAPEPAAGDGEEPLSPDQLIQNLLQYRALQDEARALAERGEIAGLRRSRRSGRMVEDIPLRHVDVWDLVTAIRRLEEEISARERQAQVIEGDAEPVHIHLERLRAQVRACAEELRFADGARAGGGEGAGRAALVSAFLALLELIRLHEVRVRQHEPFGPIWIAPLDAGERALLRADDAPDEGSAGEGGREREADGDAEGEAGREGASLAEPREA